MERRTEVLSAIYKIENRKNGKLYIGSTVDYYRRVEQHKRALKKGKHHSVILQNAYEKYGEGCFIFAIICILDKDNLRLFEQRFIDFLNPAYNISKNAYTSADRRKKVYAYDLFGNYVSSFASAKEAAEKVGCSAIVIARCCRLKGIQCGGFQWRYFKARKIEKSRKHKSSRNNNIVQVAIYNKENLSLFSVFDSVISASSFLGCNPATVSRACKEKNFYINNYLVRKVSDTSIIKKIENERNHPVFQYDLLNNKLVAEFSSVSEAARATGINRSAISKCATGVSSKSGNFFWTFERR